MSTRASDKKNKIVYSEHYENKLYKVFLNRPSEKDLSYDLGTPIIDNDSYKKYPVSFKLSGEMIVIDSPTITEATTTIKHDRGIMLDTYDEYLTMLNTMKKTYISDSLSAFDRNTKWIYNIINGEAETEHILCKTKNFILIPNYTWDKKDISKLRLLIIFTDKSLASIRDLTPDHIDIIEEAYDTSLALIKTLYDINSNKIRAYFHYRPSTYQLHMHLDCIDNTHIDALVERSHNVINVIQNIKLCGDYYKKIKLQYVGNVHDFL